MLAPFLATSSSPLLRQCIQCSVSSLWFTSIMRLEARHSAFFIIPVLVLLHLYVSPFTKVEESFNIQAAHDILTNGIPSPWEKYPHFKFVQQYDHMTFSGAVPRTFIGALILSGIANPLLWYAKLSLPEQQFLGRFTGGDGWCMPLTWISEGSARPTQRWSPVVIHIRCPSSIWQIYSMVVHSPPRQPISRLLLCVTNPT